MGYIVSMSRVAEEDNSIDTLRLYRYIDWLIVHPELEEGECVINRCGWICDVIYPVEELCVVLYL